MAASISSAADWNQLHSATPRNPFDLIAMAMANGTTGELKHVSDFIGPPSGWSSSPLSVDSAPVCIALQGTDALMIADADQWMFMHKTADLSTDLAPPLDKLLFLRGGTQWQMNLSFALSEDISNLQLSFLDNAATRGEIGGTIPVIEFDATFSGVITLKLTLKQMGDISMGLRTITSTGSDWAMYESRWRIVP